MLCISNYKINQMQGRIPNLDRHPEFTMVVRQINKEYEEIKYFYNDTTLLVLQRHTVFESVGIEFFNTSVSIESGLFSASPYSGRAVYDALYYKCNNYDLKLSRKSPDQLQKLISKLCTRMDNRVSSARNWFTTKSINEIVDHLAPEITKPTESSTLVEVDLYIQAVRSNLLLSSGPELSIRIKFDINTLQWIDNTAGYEVRTILGSFHTTELATMSHRYGLIVYQSSPYQTPRYYNPQTEVIYEENIYLKTDLDLETCPSCGASVRHRDIIDDGCKVCLKDIGKIHGYSTKVPSLLKFKATKVKPSTIYLGTELEYESTDDHRQRDAIFAGKSLKGHAILKSDGSINNGFEIVTCPATLDIHLAEFKSFFEHRKEKTALHGDKNTGMHVHISKKPLSVLTVGKMTAFLNNTANKKFIEAIAGRKLNHYCNQDSSRTVSYPLVYGKGERYNTLNLNNDETVEIRIFSTPESFDDFAHKLEFSEALAIYCSPCNANYSVYNLLKHENFKTWVYDKKHSYPHLVNKLKTIQG